MNDSTYAIAVQIWGYEYPPRRDGWFSEVYGDLWSCRRTGAGFPLGFNEYIISFVDPTPTVGQRMHPPSSLRLTLMKNYLDVQGYPANTLSNHTPLQALLPTLTLDDRILSPVLKSVLLADGWEIHNLSGLHEVYDPILIDEVERLAHANLNAIPSNTDNILSSYQAIGAGSIVGNNLVADVSGLAMFHHTNNDSVGHLISQLMETYS